MEPLIRIILVMALLIFPVGSFGAEVTALKLIQPVITDNKEGMIKEPEGVACSDSPSFMVADSGNGRLLIYTLKEGVVAGGSEVKLSQIPYPGRMQMTSKGEILVLDGKLRRIARLTQQGAFVGYIEPQGLPTSAAIMPRSFKIDAHDTIYILDLFSERVLVLDPAGKYLKQVNFPVTKGERSFSDLAVNTNGDILLLDSTNSVVYTAAKDAATFTPLTKSLKEDMDFPVYLTTDNRGVIYVVDQNGGGIIVLGLDGSFRGRMLSMGWKPGFLAFPSQICLNGKGELFVADRGNNRAQIFEIIK